MIRYLLLALFLFTAWHFFRRYLQAYPAQQKNIKKLATGFIIAVVVAAALSGQAMVLNFLFALALPYLQAQLQTLQQKNTQPPPHASSHTDTSPVSSAQMNRKTALSILGLDEQQASKEAIILAHRKMIQKNHPDRGGSEFLAAQINQAKDFLLKDYP